MTRPVPAEQAIVQVLLNLGKGGMEAMAVGLAIALHRRGLATSIVALDAGGEHEPALRAAGVPYQVLNGRRFRDPRFHWRLARALRADGVRAIHTHHFATLLHTFTAAKLIGASRLIHTEHSFQYLRDRADYRVVLRSMSQFCDAFVVVGHAMESFYRDVVRVPGKRLHVVLNGVDATRFRRPEDLTAARARLGIPSGFLVGTAGRLFPEKDYGVLLRAVEIAASRIPDLHLAIVGDGIQRAELEQEADQLGIRSRVRFLGWRDDVDAILPLLDVFALSSRHEGLPLVILEAMATGLPIVTTPVGDLPMVVPQSIAGLFYPVGEAPALANHLVWLYENPEQRLAMGRAGATRSKQEYSHSSMVERYMELYDV